MNNSAKIENTDDIDVTISIRLSMKAWKKIRDVLNASEEPYLWPVSDMNKAIADLVGKLEGRVFGDFIPKEQP